MIHLIDNHTAQIRALSSGEFSAAGLTIEIHLLSCTLLLKVGLKKDKDRGGRKGWTKNNKSVPGKQN